MLMTRRVLPRGVQTSTTIRPSRKPVVMNRFLTAVPQVAGRQMSTREHLRGTNKVETAFGQRQSSLRGIEGDAHRPLL